MRTTKTQRVLQLARQKGFGIDAMKLLEYILGFGKGSLILRRYVLQNAPDMVRHLFAGNWTMYHAAMKELTEARFIAVKGMDLVILALDDTHYYMLRSSRPQRAYHKKELAGQQQLSALLHKVIARADQAKFKSVTGWDRVQGVKLPVSMEGILTGKPVTPEETQGKTLAEIEKVNRQRELTKEMLRFLCGLAALCNPQGVVYDFHMPHLVWQLRQLFEDGTVAETTCRDVYGKLLEKEVVSEFIHPVSGARCVRIEGYGEGFGPGKRYIVVPYAVFKKDFKRMEVAAIRWAFSLFFQLNNGENGRRQASEKERKNKTLNFLLFSSQPGNEDKLQRLEYYRLWLKKRCKSEFLALLFGNGKKPGLSGIFAITVYPNGCVAVKIREEYYITKDALCRAEKLYNAGVRYARRRNTVGRALEQAGVVANEGEKDIITRLMKRTGTKMVHRVIAHLGSQMSAKARNGWDAPSNLPGLLCSIYKKLQGFRRACVESGIQRILEEQREAVAWISG